MLFRQRIILQPRVIRSPNTNPDGGSATLLTIFIALVMFIMIGFLFDFGMAYTNKAHLKFSIQNSLRSALATWVQTNSTKTIDQATVQALFDANLQQDLHLDSNFNPLPGSPLASQAIVHFYVFNTVPITDPVIHDTVRFPSISAWVQSSSPQFTSKFFFPGPITITEYSRASEAPQ